MTVPSFPDADLEALCSILGDTSRGLTGSEISGLLASCEIPDPQPTMTKRIRLFQALREKQLSDKCANNVVAFIQAAMNPVRYHSASAAYEERRQSVNVVLAFGGYMVRPDGQIAQVPRASTLTEAEARARALEKKMRDRGVHADVLKFCRAELVTDNYFHAVLEATKSVAEKIREKSGSGGDGAALVDFAFGGESPLLAINSLQTDTERSEQTGFVNLLKGMFGTFRNVTGHAPRIKWRIEEADALDLLSLASYAHRRVDGAARTR